MADQFATYRSGLDSPAFDAFEITPSNSVDLPQVARALYIGDGGDVKIKTAGGTDVTFAGVPSGSILPVRAVRVYDTGTDANDIVGLV